MRSPGYLWGRPGGCIPAGIPSPLPPGCLGGPQVGCAPADLGTIPSLLPPGLLWAPQRSGARAGLRAAPSHGGRGVPSTAVAQLGWVRASPPVWASPSCAGKSALSAPISAPLCFPTGLAPSRVLWGSRLPPCRGCLHPSPRPGEPHGGQWLWGDARLARRGLQLWGGHSTEASSSHCAAAAGFPGGVGLIFLLSP